MPEQTIAPVQSSIYSFMKDNELTSKSEADFNAEYADSAKAKELYGFFTENELTAKDFDSFYKDNFSSDQPIQPEAEQPQTFMQKELRDKGLIQDEQPKEEQGFIGKLGSTVGNSFMTGMNSLNSWAADAPAFIYDLAGAPFRAVGLNVPTSQDFKDTPLQGISDFYKGNAKAYEQKVEQANPSRGNGVIASFENGDIEGGVLNLLGGIAESAPASIAMMLSGGATAPTIIGGAAIFGAGKAQEMDENAPEMDYDKRRVIAALNGTLEGVFETYLGSGAVGKSLAGIIKNEGKEVAQQSVKRSMSTLFADMITKNPWLAPLGEGLEEVGTQISQNFVDKFSGYKPNLNLTDGVGDSFLSGVGMGGIHGAVIGLAKKAMEEKQQPSGPVSSDTTTQLTVNPRQTKEAELRQQAEGFASKTSGNIQTVEIITMEGTENIPGFVTGSFEQTDPDGKVKTFYNIREVNNPNVTHNTSSESIIEVGEQSIDDFVNGQMGIYDQTTQQQELLKKNQVQIDGIQYILTGDQTKEGYVAINPEDGTDIVIPANTIDNIRNSGQENANVVTQNYGKTQVTGIKNEDGSLSLSDPATEEQANSLKAQVEQSTGGKATVQADLIPNEDVTAPQQFQLSIIPASAIQTTEAINSEVLLPENNQSVTNAPSQDSELSQNGQNQSAPIERKITTQTIGKTPIDIIEGEEFDEVVPSDKVSLEKALPILEKEFKDNEDFNVVAERVQVEIPAENKYKKPTFQTVIKSIKIVPVAQNVNNSEQQAENVTENTDQNAVDQFDALFETENNQQLNELQNEDSEKVIQPTAGIVAKEGENTPQENQGERVQENLEENVNQNILSTDQPVVESLTADPVAESTPDINVATKTELTEEQRITANNKVVDLVEEYNSIPKNHVNKKRIAFQNIQAGVQRLGYSIADNSGKLEIQSNGKKIQKIGTKQTTEDIQAHKALTDYTEEVQSFIQRFIDNPTELFGLDLHSTTKQAQQGIKNIQEGKKTVAANEVLDSFEKMFNDGVIRIKGSGVNGYYEIPIDEYLSAINEQLAAIDVEKELDSPSQVDEWLNENKNDQDLEPIDIEEFENDLENYTNGKENINPEEEAGIGTPESSNESPKPVEEEISGEAKAGIVQQSLFPVAEFPIDKLTKEEKRIKEKLDSLTPTQLKEAKKGIESIDKQINEKLSAIKASKKTIKDARKQARDEYAKDNSGKLITDNVVNSMPLIRRHTNQQGLLQREYLKLIADKEKLIDNIISGAKAQNEINWDAPPVPEPRKPLNNLLEDAVKAREEKKQSTPLPEEKQNDPKKPLNEVLADAKEIVKNNPREVIEDYGEKIGGAKKDIIRKYLNKINLNGLTLSTIFPKPDIKELLASGMSNKEVSAIKVAYEFAQAEKKNTRRTKESQVGAIRFCASYAKTVLAENLNIEFNNEGWVFTDHGKQLIQLRTSAFEKVAEELGTDFLSLDLSRFEIRELTPENTRGYVNKPDGNFEVKYYVNKRQYFQTLDEALNEFVDQVRKNTTANTVVYKRKLNIYYRRNGEGSYIGYQPSGKEVIILKDGFKNSTEAFEYKKENEADLQTMLERIIAEQKEANKKQVTRLKYYNETTRDRVGNDWRKGRDVPVGQFADTFGFKAVEFGNWATQAERQVFLNNVYDSLMDLTEILNVPAKALSLNGELSISFGSRGSGGALAHYEPERKVINLTKNRGIGSLAHEFFHGLDNYFAGFKSSMKGMKSAVAGESSLETRQELKDQFRKLYDAFGSGFKSRSRSLDDTKNKNYFGLPHEMGARAFENYILNKLSANGQVNDFLVNYVSNEDWNGNASQYPYPVGEESKVIGEVFDNLFNTIETKVEGNHIPMFRIIGETGAGNIDREEEVTTRLDNLKAAREMETSGKDAKTISLATGWEKGVDGKWRYEVPDFEFSEGVKRMINQQKKHGISETWVPNEMKLNEVISDDELFKSYPDFSDVLVSIAVRNDQSNKGSFYSNLLDVELGSIDVQANNFENFKSVLAHEIQHGIQTIEGFARGGSPYLFQPSTHKIKSAKKIYNLYLDVKNKYGVVTKKTVSEYLNTPAGERKYNPDGSTYFANRKQFINAVITKTEDQLKKESELEKTTNTEAFKKYQSIAGEVESRNVQTRMNMTPEERRNVLLSETEDVAREDQIVLMEGLGVSNLESEQSNIKATIDNLQSNDPQNKPVHYKSKKDIVSYLEANRDKYAQNTIDSVKRTDFHAIQIDDEVFINSDLSKSSDIVVIDWVHERFHVQILENIPEESRRNEVLNDLYESLGQDEIRRIVPRGYWNDPSHSQANEYLAYAAQKLAVDGKLDELIDPEIREIITNIVNQFTTLKNIQDAKNNRTDLSNEKEFGRNENVGSGDGREIQPSTSSNERKGNNTNASLRSLEGKGISDAARNITSIQSGNTGRNTHEGSNDGRGTSGSNQTSSVGKTDINGSLRQNEKKSKSGIDRSLPLTDYLLQAKQSVEQRNVEKSTAIGRERVLSFFKQAIKNLISGKSVSIGKLTKSGKEYLSTISGLDFRNITNFVLNPSDLKHIYNDHYGDNEKDKGKNIPLNDDDIRSMFDVISNPDQVIFLGVDERTGTNKFSFLKKSNEGTYNVLEVYGNKGGKLAVKTFFNTKKGIDQRVVELKNSLLSTSETYSGETLSDTKVPRLIYLNKSEREDEQLLILSPETGLAAALSTLPTSLSDKDTNNSELPNTILIDGKSRSTLNSNGKPIANSEEGIRNFWKWFGDSKVVDSEGRPLVVYHGTKSKEEFTQFKSGWFTDILDHANGYAGSEGRLYEAYLNISNVVPDEVFSNDDLSPEEIRSRYDGMIIKNKGGKKKGLGDVFVPYSPSQIKSTGNNGSFNPDDNNINFKKEVRPPLDSFLSNAAEQYQEKKQTRRNLAEVKEKVREFIQDHDLPIRRLEELVKKGGGVIKDNMKPYRDMSNSYGRNETLYKNFSKDKMEPVIKTISKIIKSGVSGIEVLPYMISKHAIERNAYMRENEFKEWEENAQAELQKWTDANIDIPQATKDRKVKEFNDEVQAKRDELQKKDYSGVKGFDPEKRFDNPDELAQNIVDEFEDKVSIGLVDELWENVKEASSDIVNFWKAGQTMSAEQAEITKNRYKYFIPLRGWREGAAKQLAYKKGDGFAGSLQRAKGRTSFAENPLAYLQQTAFKAIGEQVDNEVKTSLLNLVTGNYDTEFQKYYHLKKAYYVKVNLPDGTFEWEMTMDRPSEEMFASGDAKTKIYEQYQKLRTPSQAHEHEIYIKRPNGDMIVVMSDEMLPVAQAMNHKNTMYRDIFFGVMDAEFWNKPLSKTIGRANNWLKAMYTAWNVVFPLTNFARDVQEASITQFIKGDSGHMVLANYKNAFPAIVRDLRGKTPTGKYGMMLQEFRSVGGNTGYTHLKTPEQLEKEIKGDLNIINRKGTFRGYTLDQLIKVKGAVEAWNQVFEDATRFSVYITSRENGKSMGDAASDAKEASVNFNRKGKSSKAFDSVWAFWNVAIQSMQKNFKLAKDHPGRFSIVAGSWLALGFLEAMLNDMAGGDDDEDYYNISAYVRENYLILPNIPALIAGNKSDKYLRIPLSQFWRGFKSAGSIAYDVYNGKMDATTAAGKTISNFLGGLLPIDMGGFIQDGEFSIAPIVPTIYRPINDIDENRDYMGFKIAKEPFTKEQEARLADSGLGKDNVNPAIKFCTDWLFRAGGGDNENRFYSKDGVIKEVPGFLDINPSVIEHLITGYTGGTGRFIDDALTTAMQAAIPDQEVDFKNAPFLNSFFKKIPEAKWKIIGEYYDLKSDGNESKFDALKTSYFNQEDKTKFKELAPSGYYNEFNATLDAYDEVLTQKMKFMDYKTAEGSEEVTNTMKDAINAIKEVKQKYNR